MYVGAVSSSHILVQEETSLLLLDMGKLSKDLFYQLVGTPLMCPCFSTVSCSTV